MISTRSSTCFGARMEGARLWVAALVVHSVLASSLALHHRRSMAAQTILPVSKGGWRPVVGSGSYPGFGPYQAAPLHAPPAYKIPVQIDSYASSSRPLVARDTNKVTAQQQQQQYRPTTLRTQSAAPSSSQQAPNQPINSYLNPFGLQTGLSHYKIVQNYPMESVVIRNPHNPYMARPTFSKYPLKYKQAFHNAMMQQLNHVQPVQFGLQGYPTNKPHDVFSKPVEVYARPTDAKKQTYKQDPNAPEIYKPEVYKLPDSDTAQQSLSQQQVKTAQQQQNLAGTLKPPPNPYQHYPYKEEKFAAIPPSLLGTISSFGAQTIRGRDPIFSGTKTTYVPPAPTKQTIFNSFSYTPTFQTSPHQFISTTPKLQSNYNHLIFGTTGDFKAPPTQQVKLSTPFKTEQGTPNKGTFKASPQDPFAKHSQQQGLKKYQNSDFNKLPQVTTYSPSLPQTTSNNNHYNNDLSGRRPSQQTNLQHAPFTSYYNQNYDKKHKIQDNYASSVNQPQQSQYNSPPQKHEIEATPNSVPFRATYDVTEIYGDDIITHTASHSWSPAPDSYGYNTQQKPASEDTVTKSVYSETNNYGKPTTNLPEEYEIVTEGDDSIVNHIDTQSRRPNEEEPIIKHKLKDYYYKVSTPAHEEVTSNYKRPKVRPSDATVRPTEPNSDYTTNYNVNKDTYRGSENDQIEALPTLPPNQHFKRPNLQEPLDKDRIRKRNKNRRRRPAQANRTTEKEETTTRRYVASTTESYTTEGDEVHTYRPRQRITSYLKVKSTTPSTTNDLSTSALPTISPTTPTKIITKKKVRRPVTTPADRYETTTVPYEENDLNRESPIMKIATRDYSHKQDEKDTPTSDIAVSISDTTGRNRPEPLKFVFHKDVQPLEANTESDLYVKELEKPTNTDFKETNLPENGKKDNKKEVDQVVTTTTRTENDTSNLPGRVQRPRLKNKYDNNRPRFSVKDYRSRMSSTTSTEKPNEQHSPKLKFPQRRLPFQESKFNSESDNTTETPRKKFIPKDPRHKTLNGDDNPDITTTERDLHTRSYHRQRTTSTTEANEGTQKPPSRVRTSVRRIKPTEETTETSSQATHTKRPSRKKVKDSDAGESVHDIAVTETTVHAELKDETSTERKRSESAIMKIAKDDKKHLPDHMDALFEHSKRVSDLTLAASKDYNTPGLFKAVSPNSRRIPNYFTIATDDPILPIEAFFPQLNQKKEP